MLLLNSIKNRTNTVITFIFLGLFITTIFAQEKDELKSKLDNLKGKVERLTVKVDGKDVVFEGKDAENLVQKLKGKTHAGVMFMSGDDCDMMETGKGNVMMLKSKSGKDNNIKLDDDQKKVKIEIEDGNKKVSVTTSKNGKEETKVYEGVEAEKFLKDEKENMHVKIFTEGDEDTDCNRMMYFYRNNEDGCNNNCCGGGKRMMMSMPHKGRNMKHMILKEFNDDDDKNDKIEKKVEKKIEKK